jgi:His-Xaa-Ser system protein HxsD
MIYDLLIDSTLFSEDTILAALNTLAAKISIDNIKKTDAFIHIRYLPKDGLSEERIKFEIHQGLIQQRLKDQVYEKTKDIRTLILDNAFSKTSLIDY